MPPIITAIVLIIVVAALAAAIIRWVSPMLPTPFNNLLTALTIILAIAFVVTRLFPGLLG